jgi:mRNA interferase MazF
LKSAPANVTFHNSTVVVIAAITTTIPAKRYPFHVFLPAGQLAKDGTILCNQLRTVARARLERYAGVLDPALLGELDDALTVSLGLPRGVAPPRT